MLRPVYPCTYRELRIISKNWGLLFGISLYLQGTRADWFNTVQAERYIPVPTGNSMLNPRFKRRGTVYPCTYRELN